MTEVYEIRLSPRLAEMLLWLTKTAEGQGVVSVVYRVSWGDDVFRYSFHMEKESKAFEGLREDAIFVWQALGFVCARENKIGTLVLTPQAFEWADYQRKRPLGKAIYRAWKDVRPRIGLFFTILVTAIATALAVAQLWEIFVK